MRVTTESGTVYVIEGGFWKRNDESKQRLLKILSIPHDAKIVGDIVDANISAPKIGYRMYLSNFEIMQVSTGVVKVEE